MLFLFSEHRLLGFQSGLSQNVDALPDAQLERPGEPLGAMELAHSPAKTAKQVINKGQKSLDGIPLGQPLVLEYKNNKVTVTPITEAEDAMELMASSLSPAEALLQRKLEAIRTGLSEKGIDASFLDKYQIAELSRNTTLLVQFEKHMRELVKVIHMSPVDTLALLPDGVLDVTGNPYAYAFDSKAKKPIAFSPTGSFEMLDVTTGRWEPATGIEPPSTDDYNQAISPYAHNTQLQATLQQNQEVELALRSANTNTLRSMLADPALTVRNRELLQQLQFASIQKADKPNKQQLESAKSPGQVIKGRQGKRLKQQSPKRQPTATADDELKAVSTSVSSTPSSSTSPESANPLQTTQDAPASQVDAESATAEQTTQDIEDNETLEQTATILFVTAKEKYSRHKFKEAYDLYTLALAKDEPEKKWKLWGNTLSPDDRVEAHYKLAEMNRRGYDRPKDIIQSYNHMLDMLDASEKRGEFVDSDRVTMIEFIFENLEQLQEQSPGIVDSMGSFVDQTYESLERDASSGALRLADLYANGKLDICTDAATAKQRAFTLYDLLQRKPKYDDFPDSLKQARKKNDAHIQKQIAKLELSEPETKKMMKQRLDKATYELNEQEKALTPKKAFDTAVQLYGQMHELIVEASKKSAGDNRHIHNDPRYARAYALLNHAVHHPSISIVGVLSHQREVEKPGFFTNVYNAFSGNKPAPRAELTAIEQARASEIMGHIRELGYGQLPRDVDQAAAHYEFSINTAQRSPVRRSGDRFSRAYFSFTQLRLANMYATMTDQFRETTPEQAAGRARELYAQGTDQTNIEQFVMAGELLLKDYEDGTVQRVRGISDAENQRIIAELRKNITDWRLRDSKMKQALDNPGAFGGMIGQIDHQDPFKNFREDWELMQADRRFYKENIPFYSGLYAGLEQFGKEVDSLVSSMSPLSSTTKTIRQAVKPNKG